MDLQESGRLISAKQTSEMLGISRATLSKIKNSIGFYRIGGQIKFRLDNVENFLNAAERLPAVEDQLPNRNGGNQ